MPAEWFDSKFSTRTSQLNYCWLILIFTLNFLGLPALKFAYLGYSAFVYLGVLLLGPRTAIPLIISYSFIEGQGRILWGYHPAARIAFDILIVLATVRGFITRRDVRIAPLLPRHMIILIALHFLWYAVEIFNISGINTFAAIAGTKVYIFPFFLLIYLRQNEDTFTKEFLHQISLLILILLIGECALSFYQLQQKEDLLLGISTHYRNAMRGDIFTGDKFRPFGTTQLPGAISVFIFLSMSFLFLRKTFRKWFMIVLPALIYLCFIILIASQVRSALIKAVLVLLGTLTAMLLTSKKKTSLIVRILATTILALPITVLLIYPRLEQQVNSAINLEVGMARWEGLDEVDDVSKHRLTPGQVYDIMLERLKEFPIGVGPAMTGASGSLSVDLVKEDPIYDKNTFWGYDNFYLSMIVEFGFGAIFYLAYFLCVPLALVYFLRSLRSEGHVEAAKIVAVSLVNILTILLGNWGAIGITYNPESFFFWLWTAIGFNVYHLSMTSNPQSATFSAKKT